MCSVMTPSPERLNASLVAVGEPLELLQKGLRWDPIPLRTEVGPGIRARLPGWDVAPMGLQGALQTLPAESHRLLDIRGACPSSPSLPSHGKDSDELLCGRV